MSQLDDIEHALSMTLAAGFGPLFGLSRDDSIALAQALHPLLVSALTAIGTGLTACTSGAATELDYYTDKEGLR